MKFLKFILAVCVRIADALVAFLMGAMGVVAFAAVFYRFVLHDPITWSEMAGRYMME